MTWVKTEPAFAWMMTAWRNEERGEVLVIEQDPAHVPWDHGRGWQAVILPLDYETNNEVQEYLAKNVGEEEATKLAVLYRENHD